jgi:serine/threonine protein phosphatase PrpC
MTNWMTFNQELRDQIISDSFSDAHEAIKGRILADFSGTTCVMVFAWNDLFVCGNSGDSRAILCLKNKNTKVWEIVVLSRDHKPSERDEAFRVRC